METANNDLFAQPFDGFCRRLVPVDERNLIQDVSVQVFEVRHIGQAEIEIRRKIGNRPYHQLHLLYIELKAYFQA